MTKEQYKAKPINNYTELVTNCNNDIHHTSVKLGRKDLLQFGKGKPGVIIQFTDPDVLKIYNNDNPLPMMPRYPTKIVRSGEKNIKRKVSQVIEGASKIALQQITVPDEHYPVVISRLSLIRGLAAKPQMIVEEAGDVEKEFCIGITSLENPEKRDYTKKKWHVVFLPHFGIEKTVAFVKEARNIASGQGVNFFKMIVISTSEDISATNEDFSGTAVILRHYEGMTDFSACLEKLDKELRKYQN